MPHIQLILMGVYNHLYDKFYISPSLASSAYIVWTLRSQLYDLSDKQACSLNILSIFVIFLKYSNLNMKPPRSPRYPMLGVNLFN